MPTMFHNQDNTLESKMHSPTRELVLQVQEGKRPEGMIDGGMFKGTNTLKAVMQDTGLWAFKFEKGIMPDPLKQRFTNINKAVAFAKEYFAKRNIDVIEVKDIHAS